MLKRVLLILLLYYSLFAAVVELCLSLQFRFLIAPGSEAVMKLTLTLVFFNAHLAALLVCVPVYRQVVAALEWSEE